MEPLSVDIETLRSKGSELLQEARNITDKIFGRKIWALTPGPRFPNVSITGTQCSLNCAHCNKHYLEHMYSTNTPEILRDYAYSLAENNGVGFLLSGGFNSKGKLPLHPYLDVISDIKNNTNLLVEVHTGLVTPQEASDLASAGIDIACVDLIGARSTISEVYHLNATPQDYLSSIHNMIDAGIPFVAPHLTLGLHFGKILGEWAALDLLQAVSPSTIIFLIIIPTLDTQMANITPPSPEEVSHVIAAARILFPQTDLALGCMRPTGLERLDYDIAAIQAGVNRIVMPRQGTQKYLVDQGYSLFHNDGCCAIPKNSLTNKK